jgi:hypothetical protein
VLSAGVSHYGNLSGCQDVLFAGVSHYGNLSGCQDKPVVVEQLDMGQIDPMRRCMGVSLWV